MLNLSKVKFEFPLHLSERNKEMFILEGFAVANDFDLQNDIISDKALRRAVKDFKENGEFRLRHTEEKIGKILDVRFTKGKIWIKTIITDSLTIEKVKSGELNCLSVGGQINGRKVERIFAPDLRILINIIDNVHFEEVSLVPQGAQPQAKAIRWYIKSAVDMAEKTMNKKNLDEDLKNLKEIEEDAADGNEEESDESIDNSEEKVEKKNLSDEEVKEEDKEEKEDEKEEDVKDEKEEDVKDEKEGDKEVEEVKDEKEEEKEEEEVPEEETPVAESSEPTYREPEQQLSDGKDKKIVYQIMNSSNNIELEDKKDLSEFKKELLRVGEWRHSASSNGMLKVTQDTLKTIVKNFKNKVLDNVMVPLGHPSEDDPSKNVGEVTDLSLSKDNNKLIATIDVREKSIIGKIKDRLIKGISASIAENYMEKDTGKHVGPVIFHAALVGEPYVKGMAGFVPLSEEFKDSTVISIMNMEEPLTLNDLSDRVNKIEEKLRLGDESLEEDTSEEVSKETTAEETSDEKPLEKEDESSETDSDVKGEEENSETEENKSEESETEESETETEEAKDEGVDLADAEKLYDSLLKDGRVTPAEKELIIPLLASKTQIELSENEMVASGKALFDYLMKQAPKIPLSENGSTGSPEQKENEEKVPEEISAVLREMQLSEDVQKETYKAYKKEKEVEKGSTPF